MGVRAERRKRKKKNQTKIVIVLLIIMIFIIMRFTYAKFTDKVSGSASMKIAKIDLNSSINSIELNGIEPGIVKTYEFTVTNNSEVSMNYKIKINTQNTLPLSFSLKRVGNDGVEDTNILNEENISSEEYLDYGGTTGTYKLYVTWDSSRATNYDWRYSEEIDCINIELDSYQSKSVES